MSWTWHFTDVTGQPVDDDSVGEHSNQGDAESALGEMWRDLADKGAVMAILKEDGRTEYEMPLTPPD
ncbi:MAG TPA: hypothetical protein H9881_07310 [Candidatus Stackebrandtia excrementipullorum]|nr:hypothetical protein [Candidatus Stackebrandtia excrementipullorum]